MLEDLKVIAWETTRRCPLACRHCRGASRDCDYEGELSTAECFRVMDSIAAHARPMIIFTGGEPMYRADLPELVRYAAAKGFRAVLAPCGLFATPERLAELKAAGIQMMSLSVDGPTAELHDAFRGVPGAFEHVLSAMAAAREAGLPFQINTTVTRQSAAWLPAMRDFALEQGAAQLDCFFLVPVGRGAELREIALSPDETERVIEGLLRMDAEGPLHVHLTCAPQVVRIARRLGLPPRPGKRPVTGCMGGKSFTFISHRGELQPCGFFALPCGNLREFNFDFAAAYEASSVFAELRGGPVRGHCGICGFRESCRGCRARAFAQSGDYLGQEPGCRFA